MHVLVIAGGTSNERDVSLRSGKAVAGALKENGHEVSEADPKSDDFNLQAACQNCDVVFIALHGVGGEDGQLQAQLEALGKPFVGSGSAASKLCMDKWAYKQLLQKNNLPVADGWMVTVDDVEGEKFSNPYVLKPVDGGSTLDTQIARTPDEESLETSKELLSRYPNMLLEPLISGTEITVGILDQEPLPVIEIVPPEGLEFDYENKYNGATQELCPPVTVRQDIQGAAQKLSLEIHNITGCRDMSRTDIIIDEVGELHVLETNTIPGLTNQSLLPKMANTAGYTMPQFVDKLIGLALKR